MIEVRGKYNTAKIFTDVVESDSIAQVMELCNQEFTQGSRIPIDAGYSRRSRLYHWDDHDHYRQGSA